MGAEFQIPLPLKVLDGAIYEYFDTLARGVVKFSHEINGPGRIEFHLSQEQLGELGEFILTEKGEKLTALLTRDKFFPPDEPGKDRHFKALLSGCFQRIVQDVQLWEANNTTPPPWMYAIGGVPRIVQPTGPAKAIPVAKTFLSGTEPFIIKTTTSFIYEKLHKQLLELTGDLVSPVKYPALKGLVVGRGINGKIGEKYGENTTLFRLLFSWNQFAGIGHVEVTNINSDNVQVTVVGYALDASLENGEAINREGLDFLSEFSEDLIKLRDELRKGVIRPDQPMQIANSEAGTALIWANEQQRQNLAQLLSQSAGPAASANDKEIETNFLNQSTEEADEGMTDKVIFEGVRNIKSEELHNLLITYNRDKAGEDFKIPLLPVEVGRGGDSTVDFGLTGKFRNEPEVYFGNVEYVPRGEDAIITGHCYYPQFNWARSYLETLGRYIGIEPMSELSTDQDKIIVFEDDLLSSPKTIAEWLRVETSSESTAKIQHMSRLIEKSEQGEKWFVPFDTQIQPKNEGHYRFVLKALIVTFIENEKGESIQKGSDLLPSMSYNDWALVIDLWAKKDITRAKGVCIPIIKDYLLSIYSALVEAWGKSEPELTKQVNNNILTPIGLTTNRLSEASINRDGNIGQSDGPSEHQEKRGPNLRTQERFRIFNKLKDSHRTWSQSKVALESNSELGEIVTAETVRNTYRLMGVKWERADRIR